MIAILAAAVICITNSVVTSSMNMGSSMHYDSNTSALSTGWYVSLNEGNRIEGEKDAVTTIISTNTVTTDNGVEDPTQWYDWNQWGTNGIFYSINDCVYTIPTQPREATERTVTTTVIATDTLYLQWDGKPYTLTRKRVLSITVKRYRRRDEWEEITP